MKNYEAYRGRKFTIEWYFNDQGKSSARDYFIELSFDRKMKIDYLMRLIGDIGRINYEEKFRYEGSQIYAFKPFPDRFLCFFFSGSKIVITNAYEKKTEKLPIREKEKALRHKEDYIKRIKGGSYYAQ